MPNCRITFPSEEVAGRVQILCAWFVSLGSLVSFHYMDIEIALDLTRPFDI